MIDKVKIAAVQMEPKLMKNRENLDKVLVEMRTAASNGADLVVFPECALTGYVFTSREEAKPFMETIPGPSTDKLAASCQELGIHIIVGLLEIDANKCFNAAVLIGPQGLIGKYRKNHLPFSCVDRFLDHGDKPFKVYSTPIGNIGIYICYDCNFPESTRIMALQGADIIALPTNWPEGREKIPQFVVNTRAFENKVHLVAVDRVGVERGIRFIGHSKIIDARGDTLAEASGEEEETLYAEVSLSEAREKRTIIKPGMSEVNCIYDRRPELYSELTRAKITEPRR